MLYYWRSFEAYPGLVTVSGATSVQVPNLPDHRHDLVAMAAAVTDRTRVAIVCTPNNPTGSIVTAAEFEAFTAAVPNDLLVLLDEAYAEFVTDPTAVDGGDLLGRYPNLVILRTFSKAYGLAGLRVGYAIGPERILDAARATAIPLSVTEAAQRAALAALDHEDELMERVAIIAQRRDEVFEAVVDPQRLSSYFTTGGAKGRLESGATVEWDFADFPGAFPVRVVEVATNRRIVLRWGATDGTPADDADDPIGAYTTVTMEFESLDDGRTLVTIAEEGWQPTAPGRQASYGNCEGWTGMLAAMKVWLEHGINLREGFYK